MAEDWLALNRANWDERVPIHLASGLYGLPALRAGRHRLDPLADAMLPPLAGLRVLHLQCHFGQDTLALAARDGVRVALLPPWYDVDTGEELAQLAHELHTASARTAVHTRRTLTTLGWAAASLRTSHSPIAGAHRLAAHGAENGVAGSSGV